MLDDKTFLTIIDATPLVSIDLIIDDGEGRYLLGKRLNKPAQDFWFVPGGRIRKNETIADAFSRICQQELAINRQLQQAKLLGCYDHIYTDNYLGQPSVNTHYVVQGYRLSLTADTQCHPDIQHTELTWWSKEALLAADVVHENTKAYFK